VLTIWFWYWLGIIQNVLKFYDSVVQNNRCSASALLPAKNVNLFIHSLHFTYNEITEILIQSRLGGTVNDNFYFLCIKQQKKNLKRLALWSRFSRSQRLLIKFMQAVILIKEVCIRSISALVTKHSQIVHSVYHCGMLTNVVRTVTDNEYYANPISSDSIRSNSIKCSWNSTVAVDSSLGLQKFVFYCNLHANINVLCQKMCPRSCVLSKLI